MGRGVELRLFVVSPTTVAVSPPLTFHYAPPAVTEVVPNAIDARGSKVSLYGNNFGLLVADGGVAPVVHINGRPCLNAVLLPSQDEIDRRPYIECTAQEVVVGRHNMNVTVGYQSTVVNASIVRFTAVCMRGYYGRPGEYCEPCPSGADCAGGAAEPTAQFGFYIGYNDTNGMPRTDPCATRHDNRSRCLVPQPCEPPVSCIGDDLCSRPYASIAPLYRCAACSEGYYRIAGACRKCPNNPWLLVAGFLVAVLAAGVIGYILNRKSVNVAFLSIGIDYFQVLAMFSRSNVKWPDGTCRCVPVARLRCCDVCVAGSLQR
jgi:hypothetical protein